MKDIIWYTPTLQADGSYTVTAKAGDHENADGKYEAGGLLCRCRRSKQICEKGLYRLYGDKTGQLPPADLTITKSEKDGTFTITAKNLQGFDGYKG